MAAPGRLVGAHRRRDRLKSGAPPGLAQEVDARTTRDLASERSKSDTSLALVSATSALVRFAEVDGQWDMRHPEKEVAIRAGPHDERAPGSLDDVLRHDVECRHRAGYTTPHDELRSASPDVSKCCFSQTRIPLTFLRSWMSARKSDRDPVKYL